MFDGNHRRSILHKAQSEQGGEADLDNVLTDLSSVIADLEAFTVVSPVPCRGFHCGESCALQRLSLW